MDITGSPYDRMLGSLRDTFTKRLPGGLTPPADKRLQRTLDHYIKEILRVQGVMNEQLIMRETFDSMAGWFRRNTSALSPAGSSPVPTPAPQSQSQPVSYAVSPEPPLTMNETEDPLILFERIKATRGGGGGGSAVAPPAASPYGIPELTPIETRPKPPVVGVPPSFQSTPLDALLPSQSSGLGILQRQDDVVKYREMEYNVILNSKDRNWYQNTTENRYNFSVQLNGGATPQGRGYQATLMNRIKNIVRIEFIKAILPVEGLEVVVPRACSDATDKTPVPTAGFVSTLSNPFIQVLLDEQTGNNIGTTDTVDRSLAICQYDATWKSDQTHDPTHNRGYTLFFPKFMKAQRVFAPTPLASLQSLHFQLLNPEGLPVSCEPDSMALQRILYSNSDDVSGNCYYDDGAGADADYIFLNTREYFPIWAFSKFDRVTFAGILPLDPSDNSVAFQELASWLSRPGGHIVIDIGHTGGGGVLLGGNDCGYANWIILRNRFTDPTAGDCSREYFAGAEEAEDAFASALDTTDIGGAILNLSRQVQLFLRVITREVDPGSNVRPDNI